MTKKRKREPDGYVVRVLEAQWDGRHEQSIRPFFDELHRGRKLYAKGARDKARFALGSDPLFDYYVFNGSDTLGELIQQRFAGVGSRKKIIYIASHGSTTSIHTLTDGEVSRTQLRNSLAMTRVHGVIFGSCLFGNEANARFLLDSCHVDWVAGYDRTVDWLASTVADVLFVRMLLDGWFRMTDKQERPVPIANAKEAAHCLYEAFPVAASLGFNVFTRAKGPGGGISNTLSKWRSGHE